jgi:transcriptional regulator with XRE-family HTH domain
MASDTRIGTRIAKRRHQLGMRQEDLAEVLNVSKSTVANWETGKHLPTRHMGALEQVLGIQLDDPESSPSGPRESLRDQVRRIEDLARDLRARLDEEEEGRNHDRRRRGA